MEQTETLQRVIVRQASVWGRLAATAVAHMTEHLYIGIITVALPVITSAMGLTMAQAGSLVSLKPSVDLGTISMAAGNVSFRYLIKNTGAAPLTINRIFTSCMCTSAMLVTGTQRKGPFGMPGHGPSTAVRAPLAPGELATVEVVFDPAAHGPSGLGRIERSVTVQSAEAAPLARNRPNTRNKKPLRDRVMTIFLNGDRSYFPCDSSFWNSSTSGLFVQ